MNKSGKLINFLSIELAQNKKTIHSTLSEKKDFDGKLSAPSRLIVC